MLTIVKLSSLINSLFNLLSLLLSNFLLFELLFKKLYILSLLDSTCSFFSYFSKLNFLKTSAISIFISNYTNISILFHIFICLLMCFF